MTAPSASLLEGGFFWRRHRSTVLLLATALPAIIFLLVFYIAPMALLLAESFEGGTFKHYAKALSDGLYVGVLIDTLVIAACVSLMCLLLGYPLLFPGEHACAVAYHRNNLRAAAVLDEHSGADLWLDDPARPQRHREPRVD